MGSTLCFSSQPSGIIPSILQAYYAQNSEFSTLSLIQLLRSAADQLETLQPKAIKTNNIQEIPAKIKPPVKLPYKRSDEWEVTIKKIVMESDSLRTKPFSGISLNAYIDATYRDWEEGDLQILSSGPRWKMLASVALGNLLQDNFIEREPGAKKHYRVTQDALANYF
jgi:hypothetical protein